MKVIFYILILTSYAFSYTTIASKLYFSETPITFYPPAIVKNKTTYVPIRTLIDYFDGNIKKSKKTSSYTITMHHHVFTLKENISSYTVNKQSKKFKSKPIFYNTRLYVPLYQILNDLGYQLITKNKQFYAHKKSKSPPPSKKQGLSQSIQKKSPVSLRSNKNNTYYFDYKQKIPYKDINKIYLPISKVTLPFKYIIRNQKYYIDINQFLNKIGYSTKSINNFFLLKKSSTIYSFKNGSNKIKITNNNKISSKSINYKVIIKNDHLYVPFQKFLNDLGFDFSHYKDTLTVLKKLNYITLDKNQAYLSKNSGLKLSSPYYLNNPNRVYWDLPYTKCPEKNKTVTQAQLNKISFGQRDYYCRMVFTLTNKYRVSLAKNKGPISTIQFQNSSSPSPAPFKRIKSIPTISYTKPHARLKGKTIVIDPGHGGSDPGAVAHNVYEKKYTLDISKRIATELKKRGAKVVMLRTGDSNPSLYQRVKKINAINGDFLISVHVNSFIKPSAHGTETYYYKPSEKIAAKYIQKHLVSQLKLKNNGIKKARMYILKYSKTPGVLIEPCFITNNREFKLIKSAPFRQKIALASVNGLSEYFKNR